MTDSERFDKSAVDLLNPILDLAGGADGGGGYMRLRALVARLMKQAAEGDAVAAGILSRIGGVSKLCTAAMEGKV